MNKNSFLLMLEKIGYKSKNNLYVKNYPNNVEIKVDKKEERIIYPDTISTQDKTTCNFSHEENFVVLECIDRLLEKGYRAEHLELEKKWKLGHTQKSGKSDIIVYKDSKKENVLLIIECKTYGSKYKQERERLFNDGGQLFSYWQQENSTQWLSLYSSDFKNGEIVKKNEVISCKDDANLVLSKEKNPDILLYKNAYKAEDKFRVWKETYNSRIYPDIIFNDDTQAYQIGVRPLRKKDLIAFTNEDNISEEFEEILRHNSISDKDNAFNKLCGLFICKLVDELIKNDNDVMDFQYKEGSDSYETIIERLQKLYHKGMQEFMKEEIFYIPTGFVKEAFINYTGTDREETIKELNKVFRNLKFYSNNDFAFKDVHNEELFYQNGKVLVEVIKLFEKYKIIYNEKQQFLGELFEKLLNNGFKQDEGQFFTPMPIARFMWQSLPLEKFSKKSVIYPKIIDYSCGAGHFLTEGIDVINTYLNQKDTKWVRDSIYGIEKDYRLARVSKISLFMNGVGNGNIVYGDGLDNYPDKNIKNDSFDYVVANPPYSIEEFKRHIKLKNNTLKLIDGITDKDSAIEILFMERIVQLLKDNGYCAVILPSGVLHINKYSQARKMLLENCKIKAICHLPSGVFAATPQSTVILFMERSKKLPKFGSLMKDTINNIINNTIGPNDKWKDNEYFNSYLNFIELDKQTYYKLISGNITGEIDDSSYLYQYKDYDKESIIKAETEKMYFYFLCLNQETLIVKAPTKTSELQHFLGYKWVKQELKPTSNDLKLSDTQYKAKDTLSYVINEFFNNIKIETSPYSNYYSYEELNGLINYNSGEFEAKITHSDFNIQSDFPMIRIKNILIDDVKVEIKGGTTAPNDKYIDKNGKNLFVRAKNLNDLIGNEINMSLVDRINDEIIDSLKLYEKGTIVFPKSGQSINTNNIAILGEDAYCVNHLAGLYHPNKTVRQYLYYLFSAIGTSNLKEADSSYPTIKLENIKNFLIPNLLDKKYKKELDELLAECEKLNEKFNTTNMNKKTYRENLYKILKEHNVVK